MKIKIVKDGRNYHIFNYGSGLSINIGDENLEFSSPKLLDVSITNYCSKNCKYCYKVSNNYGKHISLNDYELILNEAQKCGVEQIALGGGNPNQHPYFIEILKMTNDYNIVVNYSTNGLGLSDEILFATQKYCGSIALSLHDDINSYKDIIHKIKQFDICLNLHVILSNSNMNLIMDMLNHPPDWINKIDTIVFLNYKPFIKDVEECINKNDSLKELFDLIYKFRETNIGFDTCSISYLANYMSVQKEFLEYCEAARYSAYISENLDVLPCSFYDKINAEKLYNKSLLDIWNNNDLFVNHRKKLKFNNCANFCDKYNDCHGGCPIYDINNICKK